MATPTNNVPIPKLREIKLEARKITVLASKNRPSDSATQQPTLPLGIQLDTTYDGIGMGVLSDGTPYLNQRGLAVLCGVENAHIGNISADWNDLEKPRIKSINNILQKSGYTATEAHVEIVHAGRMHHCYPAEICLAILEYYAFDAGSNCQTQARENFRTLAGTRLRDLIYSQVGYDPSGLNKFDKWHERIALNFQSAPKGHFHVFNEASTIVYEMIVAGAQIDEKTVVDISIGSHWSKHWVDNNLDRRFGARSKYPHRFPESHPQSKANPHESWCYPLEALGYYRNWLQEDYIEGGKFSSYLKKKAADGALAPSVAQLVITGVCD